jgi:hypothetical protein
VELQEIEIFIDQEGKVRIQVRGVKGAACLDITKELEEALGGQIELREMTPEALESAVEQAQQRQQRLG